MKYHNLECLATCNNWGIASSCIRLASAGRPTAWFSERRHLWEGWLLVLHKGCSDGFVLRMYRWHRFQREPKKNSQSQHHSRWCSMTSPPSSFSAPYIYIYIGLTSPLLQTIGDFAAPYINLECLGNGAHWGLASACCYAFVCASATGSGWEQTCCSHSICRGWVQPSFLFLKGSWTILGFATGQCYCKQQYIYSQQKRHVMH